MNDDSLKPAIGRESSVTGLISEKLSPYEGTMTRRQTEFLTQEATEKKNYTVETFESLGAPGRDVIKETWEKDGFVFTRKVVVNTQDLPEYDGIIKGSSNGDVEIDLEALGPGQRGVRVKANIYRSGGFDLSTEGTVRNLGPESIAYLGRGDAFVDVQSEKFWGWCERMSPDTRLSEKVTIGPNMDRTEKTAFAWDRHYSGTGGGRDSWEHTAVKWTKETREDTEHVPGGSADYGQLAFGKTGSPYSLPKYIYMDKE